MDAPGERNARERNTREDLRRGERGTRICVLSGSVPKIATVFAFFVEECFGYGKTL